MTNVNLPEIAEGIFLLQRYSQRTGVKTIHTQSQFLKLLTPEQTVEVIKIVDLKNSAVGALSGERV